MDNLKPKRQPVFGNEEILKEINDVRHFICRLDLLSSVYGPRELNQKLGVLKKDMDFDSGEDDDYEEKYLCVLPDGNNIDVFCVSKDGSDLTKLCLRQPVAGLSNLIKLNKLLPHLVVGKSEYATDFFTDDPDCVYDILTDILFLPNDKDCVVIKDISKTGERETNRALKAGAVEVYERGKSEDKIDMGGGERGWPYNKCDRLRFCFEVEREQLKWFGISTLSDLIHRPHFFKLFKDCFSTFKFKKHSLLPKGYKVRGFT